LLTTLQFYVVYIWYLVALAIGCLCVWQGDQPLRWTAIVVIVSWSVTPLFSHWDRHGVNVPVSVIDTNTALALGWISLRWRTLWSAVMTGLTVLMVLCPFIAAADPSIHRASWIGAGNMLAICHLLTMLTALWLTVRARRRANEGALQF
jgi:hypothetical protein